MRQHRGVVRAGRPTAAVAAREFVVFFGEGALSLVAGMYPFSVPTDAVRQVIGELGFPDPHDRFVDGLRTGLSTWLIGAAAQSPA